MGEHFLNIPIFEWRCVTLQFKENAQNYRLFVSAPNTFYGDRSQLLLGKR